MYFIQVQEICNNVIYCAEGDSEREAINKIKAFYKAKGKDLIENKIEVLGQYDPIQTVNYITSCDFVGDD